VRLPWRDGDGAGAGAPDGFRYSTTEVGSGERRLRSRAGFLLFVLAACGGKSSEGEHDATSEGPTDVPAERVGPPCWGLSEPLDEPATPLEEACMLVIEQHRRELDAAFTRYARGEVPVYEGELRVVSDLPEYELTNPEYYESDRRELDGNVVARIVPYSPAPNVSPHPLDPGNGLALEIVDREQRNYSVVLQSDGQDDDSVVFSTVLPFGGWLGSLIPGAIPGLSLASAPDQIDFDFDERYEARHWLYRVVARGTLVRVEPDEVTPEQAIALDREQTTQGFESSGAGLTRRVEKSTGFDVATPEGLDFVPSECRRSVEYSMLESVDPSTLATGVSEVLVSSTELCCTLCRGPECIDSGFRRECRP
jgi:hypothetical protein